MFLIIKSINLFLSGDFGGFSMNSIIFEDITIFVQESEQQPIPLEDYVEKYSIRLGDFVDDETRVGEFIVNFKFSTGMVTWTVDFHEREEGTQCDYILYIIFKWVAIWEWYSQRFLKTQVPFRVYATITDMVKGKIRPQAEMEERLEELADYTEEGRLFYFGTGPFDDFKEAEQQIDLYLEYDEINSKEKIRQEGLYFDSESKRWIDIRTSLPMIEKSMRRLLAFL